MADTIKWSGIEQTKYGLTARWYVSAYYGNDIDVDGAGYYNPSTNPTGHGGPTRPFASLSKLHQDANVLVNSVILIDSGNYIVASFTKPVSLIGDGTVVISSSVINNPQNATNAFYNLTLLNCSLGSINTILRFSDCRIYYGSQQSRPGIITHVNTLFIEHVFNSFEATVIKNCTYINCSGFLGSASFSTKIENIDIINSPNLTVRQTTPRPTGIYMDFSIVIGTVKSN